MFLAKVRSSIFLSQFFRFCFKLLIFQNARRHKPVVGDVIDDVVSPEAAALRTCRVFHSTPVSDKLRGAYEISLADANGPYNVTTIKRCPPTVSVSASDGQGKETTHSTRGVTSQ